MFTEVKKMLENRDYFGGNCMQRTFEKKYIKSIFGDISLLHSSEIRDV